MKNLICSLLLVPLFLFSWSSSAEALQDNKQTTQAECLQACWDQYQEDIKKCKDACWVCDVWILWCWSGHVDEECLADCKEAAKEAYEACKAECQG